MPVSSSIRHPVDLSLKDDMRPRCCTCICWLTHCVLTVPLHPAHAQMAPKSKRIGRHAKGSQSARPQPNSSGSAKRSRESPGGSAKPSPSSAMPPPPPKAPRRADDAEDASEWTMPSLSDDPHKALQGMQGIRAANAVRLATNLSRRSGEVCMVHW
jgi:hypothetical protein